MPDDVQQQIAELRRKLASLADMRDAIGEEAYQKGTANLEAQIQILTGGGALVVGDMKLDHGSKFVGRDDQSISIEADVMIASHRMLRVLRRGQSPVDLQLAMAAYLRYLIDRHAYLSFKGLGVSDRIPLRLMLLDLYVPLKARLELPEGETWKRDMELAGRTLADEDQETMTSRLSEPLSVIDLLGKRDGLIVLGDPGAGKTTFLKFLVLQLASGHGEAVGMANRLPILIPLSAYASALCDHDIRLDDFIAEYHHDIGIDCPLDDMLRTALNAGTALILLDGLDEVKDVKLRHIVIERVTDFYTFHQQMGNKFVITSRIIGYRAVRPSTQGLLECTLIDFDDGEIKSFVTHWTSALEKQVQGQTQAARLDAVREQQALLDAVQRNSSVRRLAANPLLLTILALMKRQGVTLPERRVELFDQYVKTLLSSWNRARGLGRPPTHDLDVVQTIRMLAPLALWMHEVNSGVGLVKREDLRRKLNDIYIERGEVNPEAATTLFIDDVHEHAGLLLERGLGEYGFIHLTIEEYLAAMAVALKCQSDANLMAKYLSAHVGDDAWREVTRLTISYVGLIQQLDQVAGETAEQLATSACGEAGQAVVVAGEAVLDAWPGGVPPASKRKIIDALLPAMLAAEVRPHLRRRAGLVLGRFGWQPDDLDQFVEVLPGKFLYGDKREEREINYRYWLAKYPVTNAQYMRFIDAGGYKDQQWWSTSGWNWRTQKNITEPRSWHDLDRNNPIFPVVSVTVYEAEAYANWLNAHLREFVVSTGKIERPINYRCRLAMEEEWERAARGTDGREYPWSDDFDFANANAAVALGEGIGTTAVCTYPHGVSPTGAWDMSGNVSEWTNTAVGNGKVLRGGSWLYRQWLARCAYRDGDDSEHFSVMLGFRVVLSPASGEF